MRNNTVLKDNGMRILAEHLGLVEAERFIALLRQEPFDYTQWRQGLFKDVPLNAFLRDAQKFRDEMRKAPSRKGKATAKTVSPRRKVAKRLAHT